MENFKTIRDVSVKGKRVLVRVDYNVPLENGNILDDLRIKESLPTLKYLIDHGAEKIILISHLGRPEGRRHLDLSLKPSAERLQKLLPDTPVRFVDDVCGPDVENAVKSLPRGGIILLENLRFYPDEEENSEDFVREIIESTHANLFVQDGFAVIHRAHASTDAITHLLPSVAGLLVEKEVSNLSSVIKNPKRPLLVIIGGAKVADKQPMIELFSKIADQIAVGGKIAADGFTSDNPKVYVAEDFVSDDSGNKLDIGPKSTAKILEMINSASTVIWNGLLGYAEDKTYALSSERIAIALGKSNKTTIIGGGDTAGFVENIVKFSPDLKFTLVSTGGGASLDLLSGKSLPGLNSLEEPR